MDLSTPEPLLSYFVEFLHMDELVQQTRMAGTARLRVAGVTFVPTEEATLSDEEDGTAHIHVHKTYQIGRLTCIDYESVINASVLVY